MVKIKPTPLQLPAPRLWSRFRLSLKNLLFLTAILGAIIFSLPFFLALNIEKEKREIPTLTGPFPVTVDPKNKIIVEQEDVNAFFETAYAPLRNNDSAPESLSGNLNIFERISVLIASAPWYQGLASVNTRFVVITPGMRKEEVASTFGKVLGWDKKKREEFLKPIASSALPLTEGSFSPGVYSVSMGTTPLEAQEFINERFRKEVLSRYATSTAEVVALKDALTIASLIQREAAGPEDMRLVSGVIWNRLFLNMKLQMDATLQYAKANSTATGAWWPKVVPKDKFRKSAYNTYIHKDLPPAPIANPSVAAILAALNPKQTSCIFYFHDDDGVFQCTATYAEHVALLKKHYGQGK